MPSSGLSSDYLLRLCDLCLTNPPEIMACDDFYSKSINGEYGHVKTLCIQS